MYKQQKIKLTARSRGFHLITDEVERRLTRLSELRVGLCTLFLQHTSASLTLNENADPTVRSDMQAHFEHLAPERAPYYQHTYEGDDDMPAHIKSSLLGVSITIPVADGRFLLGTWQGIYLGEHRNHGGSRTLIATMHGDWYSDGAA